MNILKGYNILFLIVFIIFNTYVFKEHSFLVNVMESIITSGVITIAVRFVIQKLVRKNEQ